MILSQDDWMCCSMLQYVAVCCSVLQCVAVCCSVLQCVAVCCIVFRIDYTPLWVFDSVAGCLIILQCVAVCVAVCCSVLHIDYTPLDYTRERKKDRERESPVLSRHLGCVWKRESIYASMDVWFSRRLTEHIVVWCIVLQCVAVCCSVLQCVTCKLYASMDV